MRMLIAVWRVHTVLEASYCKRWQQWA